MHKNMKEYNKSQKNARMDGKVFKNYILECFVQISSKNDKGQYLS